MGARILRATKMICRLVLAAVFIYAALGKIAHPAEFADAVAKFHILPVALVNLFAIVLPWIELLDGMALLYRPSVSSGAIILVVLNAVFIVAVASAMARGLDIECGCFTLSKAHDKIGWSLILRDSLLLVLCIVVSAKVKGTHIGGFR